MKISLNDAIQTTNTSVDVCLKISMPCKLLILWTGSSSLDTNFRANDSASSNMIIQNSEMLIFRKSLNSDTIWTRWVVNIFVSTIRQIAMNMVLRNMWTRLTLQHSASSAITQKYVLPCITDSKWPFCAINAKGCRPRWTQYSPHTKRLHRDPKFSGGALPTPGFDYILRQKKYFMSDVIPDKAWNQHIFPPQSPHPHPQQNLKLNIQPCPS